MTRKVVPLGEGAFQELQVDCGLGLATITRYNEKAKTMRGDTYSLATGKLLSTVSNHPKRVGRFVMTLQEKKNTRTYTDAVTGAVLWREDLYAQGSAPPIGVPIWSTPKRWLFLVGEEGRAIDDKKSVVDVKPGTRKKLRSTHLSDYSMGFHGIVGDPEHGSFAVFEATNRSSRCTGIFRSDLSPVSAAFEHVCDITQHGILDRQGAEKMNGDMQFDSLVCADAKTGAVKWRASTKESGTWVGNDVLTGNRLLSGKTGRLMGRLKLPTTLMAVGRDGTFVGIEGKMLVGGRIRAN